MVEKLKQTETQQQEQLNTNMPIASLEFQDDFQEELNIIP